MEVEFQLYLRAGSDMGSNNGDGNLNNLLYRQGLPKHCKIIGKRGAMEWRLNRLVCIPQIPKCRSMEDRRQGSPTT